MIGGLFLLGMAVAAGYAARTLPAGARVPVNAGVPEHSIWLSKPVGLAAWLGVGVVVFAGFAFVTVSSLAADWAQSLRVVLLPSVMLVMLAAEAGAVIVARRSAASEPGADTPAPPAASPDDLPSDSDAALLSLGPDQFLRQTAGSALVVFEESLSSLKKEPARGVSRCEGPARPHPVAG